ncbi:hypothetical protein Y032_0040g265 [Ancylostoma ceylanicum]|uniref:Uncharacterized protein n=1 Tax=Ancylostoma ceylanicum TaxID=53326 RepID=A0A016UI63_9BILA|nr:hypothetical protein Y032_0040g265 [Ancylostoma ceylanicum]
MPKDRPKCSQKATKLHPYSWQPSTRKREREGDEIDDDVDKENRRRIQIGDEQLTISRNAEYIESIDSLELNENEEIGLEGILVITDESGEDYDKAEEGEIRCTQSRDDDAEFIVIDDDVESNAPSAENDEVTMHTGDEEGEETYRGNCDSEVGLRSQDILALLSR